jgi:hypothetical protein
MDDYQSRLERHKQVLKEEELNELSENEGLIQAFKAFCNSLGVNLTSEHFFYIPTIGIIAKYPSIISRLCENVIEDKEGLMDFNALKKQFTVKPFSRGALYAENFILLAHPYFRRQYYPNNNYAPIFLDLFWRLKDPAIQSYIALDPDRVRINVDNSAYKEFDTWYGAKFTHDIGSIKNENVKLVPPPDLSPWHISFMFNDVYALYIKWATVVKDGKQIKVFYAEEFKVHTVTIDHLGKELHPTKYIHSEFDLEAGIFRHFDGAIHLYKSSDYYARRDSDFNYNIKNAVQIKGAFQKLFKLNGIISLASWMEFISHFLTGNPLVFEYFEGVFPDHISDMLKAIRKSKESD